jgi:hypothetical protein
VQRKAHRPGHMAAIAAASLQNSGDTRHRVSRSDGVTTIDEKGNGRKVARSNQRGDHILTKEMFISERELELEFEGFIQWLEECAAAKARLLVPLGHEAETQGRSQERGGEGNQN